MNYLEEIDKLQRLIAKREALVRQLNHNESKRLDLINYLTRKSNDVIKEDRGMRSFRFNES